MDDFKTFYFKIPPLTRYYLTIVFIVAIITTYFKNLHYILYYILLDYDLIIKSFQIWRLVTNIFFAGGFSSTFLMFVIMIFFHFKAQEQSAIVLKAYAVFIMMIIYLLIFLNVINLIAYKGLKFKVGFTLSQQLLLALIYINSKREPQKMVTLYFFQMKNAFYPYGLILLNIVSGGSIFDNIIGIIAGNIYYVLKDVLPVSKNLNILKTPKFLVDFVEKYYYSRLPPEEPGNNNNEGDNNNGGNFGFGTSGVINNGERRAGNNTNRGFRAFGGRGYTVG